MRCGWRGDAQPLGVFLGVVAEERPSQLEEASLPRAAHAPFFEVRRQHGRGPEEDLELCERLAGPFGRRSTARELRMGHDLFNDG